jgi:hemoglobin
MATLYERIGGEEAVFATATLLYEKMMTDPLVAPFFAGLNMDAQIRKQVAFLSWAFGSPTKYEFRPLDEAHREMVRRAGLSDLHFDAVAKHLTASLRELNISAALIDEVMTLVASTRSAVLSG